MSDLIVALPPLVQTGALWNWDTSEAGKPPKLVGFPTLNNSTKSGVQPQDLQDFIGIPIQTFNPPTPISPAKITEWIRFAEDKIEQDTNIRLCQTWIAAPPSKAQANTQVLSLGVKYNYQQLGVDFDFEEPAYDFMFARAQDEGWLYQHMRWRPVKGVDVVDPTGIINAANFNGIKNVATIYPLLNEYFRMPQTWIVTDPNRGLIRFVPATNVQMLPLFAMQLSFMGFAESVPGGFWYQYTAGLTENDYETEFSFMRQLVLVSASIRALRAMQLSINYGAISGRIQVDGLMREVKFDARGPFAGQIKEFEDERKGLMKTARSKVGMPFIGIL